MIASVYISCRPVLIKKKSCLTFVQPLISRRQVSFLNFDPGDCTLLPWLPETEVPISSFLDFRSFCSVFQPPCCRWWTWWLEEDSPSHISIWGIVLKRVLLLLLFIWNLYWNGSAEKCFSLELNLFQLFYMPCWGRVSAVKFGFWCFDYNMKDYIYWNLLLIENQRCLVSSVVIVEL